VFTFLNAVIFRADEVHNPHELFAVERQRSREAEPEGFARSRYEALLRETRVFTAAFAMGPEVDVRIDGRNTEGALVTGNFFHVLGVSAARGRTLAPADDERGERPVLVLSHRAWSRLFAGDPGVLDRTILLNRVPFHVVGVMPESFRGLTVAAPDFWAPLSLLDQFRRVPAGEEDRVDVSIVGRLRPGLSRPQALAELLVWDSQSAGAVERRAEHLALVPKQGTVPLSAETMLLFSPLFFAFGLILLIGCANVANLLLARAVARQREIGIRLAMGASRRRIVRQLLTESLLLALASAALAFGISRLVLQAVVYAITSTMPPDFGDIRLAAPPADWRVALFLVGGAMVSTMVFALAPALQATRLELVRAIRGEVVRDARPGRARSALVALQVTASVLLLICSAVFLRSALATATVDSGIRAADTITVAVTNEPLRGATLEALTSDPSVIAVAASWPGALAKPRDAFASGSAKTAAGNSSHVTAKLATGYRLVSPEYFSVLGIDIVRGRGFAETERSASAAVAVVSESLARQLWPDRDPVGEIVTLAPDANRDTSSGDEPPFPSQTFAVVGIARDVPGFQFGRFTEAVAYLPTGLDAARTSLTMRVRGDSERVRVALVDRLATIDPDVGEVITLRLLTRMASYFLQLGFWLTLALAALALVLTLSGLFSVLSYLVEQRTREIGVRVALGATRRSIGALVLAQSARPVGVGLLLGGSLAAALGGALLATSAAEEIGSIVRLFDPVAYAVSLACIVAACAGAALLPALRAGRIDPVATLRQD
jgi:predicted permease